MMRSVGKTKHKTASWITNGASVTEGVQLDGWIVNNYREKKWGKRHVVLTLMMVELH